MACLQPGHSIIFSAKLSLITLLDPKDIFPCFNFFLPPGRGELKINVTWLKVRHVFCFEIYGDGDARRRSSIAVDAFL